MLYHPNNYWKCLGKSPHFPQKTNYFFRIIQWKGIVAKAVFLLKGIPHKNYFAEISTSHVVFFQSRNDLWNAMPACVHICKSVLASFPGGQWARIHLPICGGHGLDPWSEDHTCHMPGALNQRSTSAEPTCPTPESVHLQTGAVLLTEREPAAVKKTQHSQEEEPQNCPGVQKQSLSSQFSPSFWQGFSDNGRSQKLDL